MDNKFNKLRVIPAVLLMLVIYIVMHESGHAMVILLAGSKITEFSIIHARVSFEGGSYTPFMTMWREVNGALFPLLISFVYMIFYRKDIRNGFYRIFSFVFCVSEIMSTIVWVIIPFLYMNGYDDKGEDVVKFLDVFVRYHDARFISICALMIMIIGGLLIYKKRIIHSAIEFFRC